MGDETRNNHEENRRTMYELLHPTQNFVPSCIMFLLGLVPLNPIVWCYVWYYVWHYVLHDVWLNIVINKFVFLLSEIMVTWIFRYYHIVHESIVCDLCEDYNVSTKMICLDHGNGDF